MVGKNYKKYLTTSTQLIYTNKSMKKPREYKVKMTQSKDGQMEVEYAMERVQLNQHKARWLPTDKRKFTSALRETAKTGQVTCK